MSLLAVFLATVTSAAVTAQLPTGTLSGVIVDPSGAAVVAASLHAVDIASGAERRLATAADGAFVVPGLPPGRYRVTVSALSFATAERIALIEAGQTTRLDIALTLDPVTTSVLVTLPLVQTDHHKVSAVIRRDQIEQLPFNGREFLELARLEPGVTPPVRGTNNRTFVAILGGGLQTTPRVGATRVTIDGASVLFPGAIGSALKLSPESVEEFQLVSSSFDIATGLTTNGAVNIVSRAGSNNASGGALFLYRDDTLSAYPGLRREPANPDPFFRRHHESGWFGGPLRRNRAFLFVSGEALHQDSVVSVQPALPELRALGGVFPSPAQSAQFSARIDAHLSPVQSVFARYSEDRSRAFAPLNDRTDLLPSAWSSQHARARQAIGGGSRVFGSNLLADVRFSRFDMHAPERPASARDCAGCTGLSLPRITIPEAQLALGDARTIDFDGHRYQLSSNVTWQQGQHTIRGVADWEHTSTRATIESPQTASIVLWSPHRARELNPALSLPASFVTADDVLQLPLQSYNAAVALPVPERGFQPRRIFDQLRVGAGDTWRVAPRLTINGGVAWAY